MRRRGRESGQALVLGALLLLVVALTLVATLNLGNAVHERIRLQSAADAQAHGLAVLEARAFNGFAYSNRALASAHVSLAAVHAYMSAATYAVSLYDSTAVALGVAGGAEAAAGVTNGVCELHAAATAAALAGFEVVTLDRGRRVRALERPFRETVSALEGMIDGQLAFQEAMRDFVEASVAEGGGEALAPLAAENAPYARFDHPAAGTRSVEAFRAAFERNARKKAAILREIANGSRRGGGEGLDPACNFLVNRGDVPQTSLGALACSAANVALYTPVLRDINANIVGCKPLFPVGLLYGGSQTTALSPWTAQGTALLADPGGDPWELEPSPRDRIRRAGEHTSVTAADGFGAIFLFCHDWPGTSAVILQNQAGVETAPGAGAGEHHGSLLHDVHEGHHRWKGLTTRFMEFHPVSRPASGAAVRGVGEGIDGQPFVYVAATGDLRLVARDDGSFSRERAWELNGEGRVRIGKHSLGLVPPGDGFALAKAMAYYHRPGEWREGPNFWFPYWRAKLHPFTEREARELAGAVAGDAAGEAAAAAARAVQPARGRAPSIDGAFP